MGFFPPVRSTMAPKGILSSDPVRAGLAARSAANMGLMTMVCLSWLTMGPKAETPANPPKKAIVVHARAIRGLDTA